MAYCIVATKEKNGIAVSAVPELWVKENVLWWPPNTKKNELEALRSNDNSIPGEHWKRQSCSLKNKNIKTYQEALALEELLSNFDNTEDEELYFIEQTKGGYPASAMGSTVTDFNSFFVNIAQPQSPPEEVVTSVIVNSNDACAQEASTFITAEHVDKIINKLTESFENLKDYIDDKVGRLEVRLDKLIEGNRQNDLTTTDNMEIEGIQFPFETEEQLRNLEQMLLNEEVRKNMVRNQNISNLNTFAPIMRYHSSRKYRVSKLSQFCGTSGKANGWKNGLSLIQQMFSDMLLAKYTWRGIAGSNKEAFVKFTLIRDLIWRTLNLCDRNFKPADCDSFMQNSALKHATQRINRTCKRSILDVSPMMQKKKKADSVNEIDVIVQNSNQSSNQPSQSESCSPELESTINTV